MSILTRNWQAGPLLALMLALGLVAPAWNARAGLPTAIFMELDPGVPVPRIRLEPVQTRAGDWLLTIHTEGFRFTTVCRTVTEGQPVGHAHVFRGETKIGSAYTPVVELGHLEPGRHAFEVMLRTQDHRVLAGPDGALSARIVVEVPGDVQRLAAKL